MTLGGLFFTAGLPSDAGGGQAPYPPGLYLLLMPGELLAGSGEARRLLMQGGTALNIVPSDCVIDFEIRNVPHDDPTALLARLKAGAKQIAGKARRNAPEAAIDITVTNGYPSLDTPVASDAVAFVKSLTGANDTIKVAFGTEGGETVSLIPDQISLPSPCVDHTVVSTLTTFSLTR